MLKEKQNVLLIKTPEGIVFSLLLAGPVVRFLAWVIDLACIAAILTVAGRALLLFQIVSADLAYAVLTLAYVLISIGYGIVTELYWRGQTIGKRLLRLRVMDEQGLRLQPSQIVIRNLLRALGAQSVAFEPASGR